MIAFFIQRTNAELEQSLSEKKRELALKEEHLQSTDEHTNTKWNELSGKLDQSEQDLSNMQVSKHMYT